MILRIKNYFLPCCIMLLLCYSCSQSPLPPAVQASDVTSSDLKNSLVGTWWSDELIVGIDTINNSGTSVLLEINKDEWAEKLKMKPIQTIFNPNKTYVSAYCTDEGKIIRVTAGKWTVEKNQLNIHQLYPNDKEMKYRINVDSGYAELSTRLDFDGDGKTDDLYYCQMKKIS